MNILFFHRWTGVRGGGTESHLKGLVKNFSPKHKLTLLTRKGGQIDFLRKGFPELTIITVPRAPFENDNSYENPFLLYMYTAIFMALSFIKLTRLLLTKKIRPDIISVHFATEAVIAKLIRLLFRIPYIFILEGYTPWEGKEAKYANKVVSISHYISKKCDENYGYYPEVIYIGEDIFPTIDRSALTEKLKKNSKLVLTLCRLEPRKNLINLVKAIHIIRKTSNRKDISFLIGGTGIMEEQIKKLIKELNLTKDIKLLGFVPQTDKVATYQKADIYLLPTYEEGFGIVFAEAMKSGCAIISTNKTAIPEILDGAGQLIEDPNDITEIANAVVTLIDNQVLRKKLVLKGVETAKKYDWGKLIKDYEKAYMKAINL